MPAESRAPTSLVAVASGALRLQSIRNPREHAARRMITYSGGSLQRAWAELANLRRQRRRAALVEIWQWELRRVRACCIREVLVEGELQWAV